MADTRTFEVEPLDATFGAKVRGIKLAELDEAGFRQLHECWLQYALLVLPDQHLTREQQIDFAKRFGPLEIEFTRITNVKADGTLRNPQNQEDAVIQVLRGNEGWHADSTYMPVQAKGAVFSAVVVPNSGGQTGFADMRAAYDAIDEKRRVMVESASARHSLYYSQAKVGHQVTQAGPTNDYSGYGFHDGPVPVRPLVKVHPETGRKSLAIGRHAHAVDRMDPASSDRFLQELIDFACQSPRTYHHQWQVGDTVIWDNRCLLHRATPWDMAEPRVMWHTRLAGDPASESALPAAAAPDSTIRH